VTIEELKSMTNWRKTLKGRAVYCMYMGESWRIVRVGNARVTLLYHTGKQARVDPHYISAIHGI
jgi:hypothetical protein